MTKEYDFWKTEYAKCNQSMDEMAKKTEETIQPLQDTLADLEDKVRDKHANINALKSSIMRNDITIQNLLMAVVSSK
jgi:hypothetical protein